MTKRKNDGMRVLLQYHIDSFHYRLLFYILNVAFVKVIYLKPQICFRLKEII